MAKAENIGGFYRDIDNSSLDEGSTLIDHQHRRAVVGEVGDADMGSKR